MIINNNIAKENVDFIKVAKTLDEFNTTDILEGLIGSDQRVKKGMINILQLELCRILQERHPDYEWLIEKQVVGARSKDSIDIYGSNEGRVIAIEMDKWRADQVAKKIVSRSSLLINEKFGFISYCYGGTPKMSKKECIKYFDFGSALLSAMGAPYAGVIPNE